MRFGFVSFLSFFVFTNAFQTRSLQNRFRAKPIAQTFTNHYLLKTVFINVLFSNQSITRFKLTIKTILTVFRYFKTILAFDQSVYRLCISFKTIHSVQPISDGPQGNVSNDQ